MIIKNEENIRDIISSSGKGLNIDIALKRISKKGKLPVKNYNRITISNNKGIIIISTQIYSDELTYIKSNISPIISIIDKDSQKDITKDIFEVKKENQNKFLGHFICSENRLKKALAWI